MDNSAMEPTMSEQKQDIHLPGNEAILYFSPYFIVTAMLLVWGVNLQIFAALGVNYRELLHVNHDHFAIYRRAGVITLVWAVCLILYISHANYEPWASTIPIFICPAIICCYLYTREILFDFIIRLRRVLLPFGAKIEFADYFLGDILSSTAKVISDYSCSVYRVFNPKGAKNSVACWDVFLPVPVAQALPYLGFLLRYIFKERYSLANCLSAWKYVLALSPIVYSFVQHYKGTPECISWILTAAYSLCSSIWEWYDWRLFQRWSDPDLRRNKHWLIVKLMIYMALPLFDLILRFTWLSSFLLRKWINHPVTMVVLALLEVLRRGWWIYFQVEGQSSILPTVPATLPLHRRRYSRMIRNLRGRQRLHEHELLPVIPSGQSDQDVHIPQIQSGQPPQRESEDDQSSSQDDRSSSEDDRRESEDDRRESEDDRRESEDDRRESEDDRRESEDDWSESEDDRSESEDD